jgi:hypothetical protein
VFLFASRHSDGAERVLFLERADYFYREAMRMLLERPTRFTARPRVLLTICGYMRAAFQLGKDGGRAPLPAGRIEFGTPVRFVPQKAIVKRRIAGLAAAGAAVTLGLAAWALSLVL